MFDKGQLKEAYKTLKIRSDWIRWLEDDLRMTFKDTLAACFYQIAMCSSRFSHLKNFLFWRAKSEFSGKAPTKQESNHWWFYLIPFLLSYIVRVKPRILVRILPAALVVPVLRAQNQNRNLIPDKKVSLPTKRKRGMYDFYFLRTRKRSWRNI